MADTITINELKKELEKRSGAEITKYCLRLCRFKKENKELLGFLLFEGDDIPAFVQDRRVTIINMFTEVNTSHVFYAKKTIRKILRYINKYIRIAGNKQVEAELLIQFCLSLRKVYPSYYRNRQLNNLFKNQQKKIFTAISSLHPDLQYDLGKELEMTLDG